MFRFDGATGTALAGKRILLEMNAIQSILQYEVYYLSEGRWSLHARYPGAERQEAIKDAMATEGSSGFPTKVVRETYFPASNSTETVTIYSSPKLKSMVRVPPTPADIAHMRQRAVTANQSAPKAAIRPRQANVGEYMADLLTRAIIASFLSMGAAAIVTGVVSWMLSHVDDFGISLAPDTVSSILTMVTVSMFMLGFFAFFRAGRRFKRFITAMWSTTTVRPVQQSTSVIARQMSMSPKALRPKHPSRKAMEAERTMQEVKRQRGDLDMTEPENDDFRTKVESPPAAAKSDAVVRPPSDAHDAIQSKRPEKPAEDEKRKSKEKKTEPADEIEGRPAVAVENNIDDASFDATHRPPEDSGRDVAMEPVDETDGLELQRLMVARFIAERVRPLTDGKTDDPMTRRGIALIMAGAVSHLSATSQLNLLAQERLLQFGLLQCKLPQSSIDAFIAHRDDPGDRDLGWRLQDAGRSAMAEFLTGLQTDESLAAAWQTWRMPLTARKSGEKPSDFTAPSEIYFASELRGTVETSALDYHNRLVRAAVEESGGIEIKHTGNGILAKFETGDAAIGAAISVVEDIGLSQSPDGDTRVGHVVALVPGYSTDDDPLLSPRVNRVARALAAEAQPGEIATEHAVVSHLGRGLPPGYYADESPGVAVIVRQGARTQPEVNAARSATSAA